MAMMAPVPSPFPVQSAGSAILVGLLSACYQRCLTSHRAHRAPPCISICTGTEHSIPREGFSIMSYAHCLRRICLFGLSAVFKQLHSLQDRQRAKQGLLVTEFFFFFKVSFEKMPRGKS